MCSGMETLFIKVTHSLRDGIGMGVDPSFARTRRGDDVPLRSYFSENHRQGKQQNRAAGIPRFPAPGDEPLEEGSSRRTGMSDREEIAWKSAVRVHSVT